MERLITIGMVALLVGLMASRSAADAAGGSSLGVNVPATATTELVISKNQPTPGELVEAQVRIHVGSTPLGAYRFDVTYDPAVLEFDAVLGGETPEFGAASTCGIDENAGSVTCTAFQVASLQAPTGTVSVARLKLRAKDGPKPCRQSPLALTVQAFDTNSLEFTMKDPEPAMLAIGRCASSRSAKAAADKVTICHVLPGPGANAKTREVDAESVADHLEHGDSVGPCP
jgi:hypothetical protein